MNAAGNTAELAHRRKSISVEPNEAAASPSAVSTPQKKPRFSDYEQTFLPYEKKTHEILAPETLFWADRSDADKEAAISRLNGIATSGSEQAKHEFLQLVEKRDFAKLLGIPAAERGKRGVKYPRVRDIVARLQGSSDQPVDLTEESSETKMRGLLETLKTIPMKYIHFTEDVRPPYCGTFTKIQSDKESRRLAINPFSKTLPEANYDYDSEYEWEDAEEGEDLDAEDEDDLESEGAEDLDDFLEDDDDAAHSKRRLITGDLEPVCSGLCWEDSKGVLRRADGSTDANATFSEYRMGILLEPPPTSIDPFSTVYWQTAPPPAAVSGTRDVLGMMQPPRLPLQSRPDNGASISAVRPPPTTVNGTGAPKPPKRTIPEALMAEFKDAIKGSDLTKLALIEALKKRFPKVPKDAISNTLPLVAQRVGPSAAEKRWMLLDT
ncbi:Chromatin assembly factor 1 subunit A [Macrophomina phaseolina MS6]|uniref:Chromatin assembly factor 1 subunit A n=1 Tax=Macrophomina phaseolina (strain MS6) TaxID=1126212 RepID=K2S1N7_MACPH|nr:Chromatin assembly factor 1 subunit A [Macrophomina phaseolina MS6]